MAIMKIDVATILVVVMTLAAAVFLVWLELHSRRNARQQQTEVSKEADAPVEPAQPAPREPGQQGQRRRS